MQHYSSGLSKCLLRRMVCNISTVIFPFSLRGMYLIPALKVSVEKYVFRA